MLTRNFLLTVFFIILIFITFSFGIYIGAFKIYPYEIFDSVFDNIQTKNEIIPLSNPSFDILSIIKIKTVNDILEKREELIFYIFKNNDSFYKKIPTTILQNIHDENYSDLKNLKTIDKFLI